MIQPREAAEVLDGVAGVRRRARVARGRPWFPLACFGAVTLLSAPLVAAFGTIALAPFWLLFGAVAMRAVAGYYARRAQVHGITGRRWQYWAVAVPLFALCFAAGAVAGHLWGARGGVIAPVLVVVVGYAAFAAIQRAVLPVVLVALAAAVTVAVAATPVRVWVVELVFGALLLLAAAVLAVVERRELLR